jgi:hypothetical protein
MARSEGVTLVAVLGGGVYAGYETFTGSGAVGWLNAAQQRFLGSYQPLLSFAVVLLAVMGAVTGVWAGVARLLRPPEEAVTVAGLLAPSVQPQASSPVSKPPGQARTLGLLTLVLLPLTWLLGWGATSWLARESREDAAAAYQAVELTDGVPLPQLTGTHVALKGIPLLESTVSHQTSGGTGSGPDYQFIPLVGVGWRPGHPVHFVAKVGAGEVPPSPAYPPDPQARNPREVVLLAKTAGSIPEVAAAEFLKVKVPLDPKARLLRLVPSLAGVPMEQDTSGEALFIWGICAVVSVMLLVMPVVGLREDARRRVEVHR